jgi:predicted nucleic acid-binding protein
MIILDTNVLSAIMAPRPELAVARWLDRQPRDSIWITTITVMEILAGLHGMPMGRRRGKLTNTFESLLRGTIQGRIAQFDTAAAEQAGQLMAQRKGSGRMGDVRDAMIGGIALAARATVATRNVAHFADLSVAVVNPWEA